MKWFECILDCGDGSNTTLRFKTKEDAEAYAANQEDFDGWGCYPFGELEEVDTESKYFWEWPDPWS